MIKEIIGLWNKNFDKGVTIFQMSLMTCMIIGAVLNNYPEIIFSMVSCLLGYFEPTNDRFYFNLKKEIGK